MYRLHSVPGPLGPLRVCGVEVAPHALHAKGKHSRRAACDPLSSTNSTGHPAGEGGG